MKIVILGSNGQLGSDISISLQKKKDNSSFDLIKFTRKDFDLEDSEALYQVLDSINFGILINCTGYHKTEEVEKNASLAVRVNSHAVQDMARICQEKKAVFMHVSTDYVFDGMKITPYTEKDAPAPINVYGASKYLGETLALSICEKIYILRVASLFGIKGSSGKGGNFVENIISNARKTGDLNIVDDIVMSPTGTRFVADIVNYMIRNKLPYGIYNAVNSGEASWYQFAKCIVEKVKIDTNITAVPSSTYPSLSKRPVYSVLSTDKLAGYGMEIIPWKEELDFYLDSRNI